MFTLTDRPLCFVKQIMYLQKISHPLANSCTKPEAETWHEYILFLSLVPRRQEMKWDLILKKHISDYYKIIVKFCPNQQYI